MKENKVIWKSMSLFLKKKYHIYLIYEEQTNFVKRISSIIFR